MIELVLGGARSGKSAIAEAHAASFSQVTYVATAYTEARDQEMSERVRLHQSRRPASWATVEEPLALTEAVTSYASPESCVLVDCLTLWLNNHLFTDPQGWEQAQASLVNLLDTFKGNLILVSNEVGQGVIPANKLSRQFVDLAGTLHQQIARRADNVIFCTAGIPQALKGRCL